MGCGGREKEDGEGNGIKEVAYRFHLHQMHALHNVESVELEAEAREFREGSG